jgi:hypothetical protein
MKPRTQIRALKFQVKTLERRAAGLAMDLNAKSQVYNEAVDRNVESLRTINVINALAHSGLRIAPRGDPTVSDKALREMLISIARLTDPQPRVVSDLPVLQRHGQETGKKEK